MCLRFSLRCLFFIGFVIVTTNAKKVDKDDPRTYQLNTTMENKSIGVVSYKHRIMTSTQIDLMFYVIAKEYFYWTLTVEHDGKLINCSLDSTAECYCQIWRDNENVYVSKESNTDYFQILIKLNTCSQHFDLTGRYMLHFEKLGQMPTSGEKMVRGEVHVLSSEEPVRIPNEGKPVVLNCVVHGFSPVIHFHWTKSSDGKIWTEIDKKRAVHSTTSVKNDTLTLTSFNNTVDKGYYKCNATQLWDYRKQVYSHDIDVFYVSNIVHGQWSDLTSCESVCASGAPGCTINRTCIHPKPEKGGKLICKGEYSANCPVHGQWSDWTSCKSVCASGAHICTKTRSCANPKPEYGGKKCIGDDSAKETCLRKENTGGNTDPSPIITSLFLLIIIIVIII